MLLADAKQIAEKWIGRLDPFCERIEIAGSIRRGKPEPKDIEIVCIPKVTLEEDIFGTPSVSTNLLERFFSYSFRLLGNNFLIKNGERYKQIALAERIKLDLFIVLPPAEWGVQFMIRTGPSDFSHWMVTKKSMKGALPSMYKVQGGAIWHSDIKLSTPEEEDVFQLVGLEYIEPSKRQGLWEAMR